MVYTLENGRTLTSGQPGGYIANVRPDPRWRDYVERHQPVEIDDLLDDYGRPQWRAVPNPDFEPRKVTDADKGGADDNQPFLIVREPKPVGEAERQQETLRAVRAEIDPTRALVALIMGDAAELDEFRQTIANIKAREGP